MNELSAALQNFAKIFGRDDIDIGQVNYAPNQPVLWPKELPSTGALIQMYSELAFDDCAVGGVFSFEISSLPGILQAQYGWREIAGQNGIRQLAPNWPESWVLIGNRNGDAIVVDTSTDEGMVYGCIQGSPIEKSSAQISPSLASFFQSLSECMRCEQEEFNLEGFDDTYAPKLALIKRSEQISSKFLGNAAAGWMHFFFG